MSSEPEAWLTEARAAARQALARRSAVGDRLALLRTLTRLEGGRLDLAVEGVSLTTAEQTALRRFSLEAVPGTSVIRLADEDLDSLVPGLQAALALDPAPRTNFPPAAADAPLLRFSSHAQYRSLTQKAAVHALATAPAGAALMVSMPTGSGKSLLFQIAPKLWRTGDPGACVVVITPTVALADDHERTLRAIPGLEASRALSGAMSPAARAAVLDAFRRGEVPVLLLSPEAAFGSAQAALLEAARPASEKFGLGGRLAGLFVDEAHIIESWGRTFRPDFQRLPGLVAKLRAANPELRTVLLSATLTQAAREVLRQGYGGGAWLEIHAGVPRYDFDLVVDTFEDPVQRDAILLEVVDRAPRPTIVYTTLVDAAGDLYRRLQTRGYEKMALFTGEVSDGVTRREIVEAWSRDELDLVVATSAFGLGVDKSNVRAVLHACLPESPARYYQEIGRASRDNHQGLGVCLWTRWRPGLQHTDDEIASDMATNAWLSRDIAELRWAALRASAALSFPDGVRRAQLRLDSAREGLSRWTGQPNRRWNMSLLNLMQRAGVIRVEHVEEAAADGPVWDVAVLDDGLMSEGASATEVWDRIYQVREAERRAAQAEVTGFKALMSGRRQDCLLTGLFDLIEPQAAALPPCGRCPACRERGATPPRVVPAPAAGEAWGGSAYSAALPPGVLLAAPDDPTFGAGLPALLTALGACGVAQVVAPDALAARVGALLAAGDGRFGFVHAQSDWLAAPHAIADLPTAVLLSPHEPAPAAVLAALGGLVAQRPHQGFVLVGDPAHRLDGRPLSQIASALAAYDQAGLAALGGDPVLETLP